LFAYWHFSDDIIFFGKYGNFSATTGPDPAKLVKYKFTVKSPVPSFTGKWAPIFDGTVDTSIMVGPYRTGLSNVRPAKHLNVARELLLKFSK